MERDENSHPATPIINRTNLERANAIQQQDYIEAIVRESNVDTLVFNDSNVFSTPGSPLISVAEGSSGRAPLHSDRQGGSREPNQDDESGVGLPWSPDSPPELVFWLKSRGGLKREPPPLDGPLAQKERVWRSHGCPTLINTVNNPLTWDRNSVFTDIYGDELSGDTLRAALLEFFGHLGELNPKTPSPKTPPKPRRKGRGKKKGRGDAFTPPSTRNIHRTRGSAQE